MLPVPTGMCFHSYMHFVSNNIQNQVLDYFEPSIDFFDSGVKPSESAVSNPEVNDAENEESKEVTMAEKLPEGFFDNPKLDAKVGVRLSTSYRVKVVYCESYRICLCSAVRE